MENQMEIYDNVVKYRDKYNEALPNVMKPHAEFISQVYGDGALPAKMKRLIALGIALRAGCAGCIIANTRRAVEAGATKDEVLEAVSVGMAMGGTPAVGWFWRAIKVLEEMGKW
jgi:AhpD family alkylhydroperoxidase